MPVGVIKIDARQMKKDKFKRILDGFVKDFHRDMKRSRLRKFVRDLEKHMESIRRKSEFGVQEIIYFRIKKDAFDEIKRKHLS